MIEISHDYSLRMPWRPRFVLCWPAARWARNISARQYPAPPAFRGADNAGGRERPRTLSAISTGQQVFREPELQELIRTALANNYDVRIAAQHVLEQQAQVRIMRSQEFPQISVGGTGIGADAAVITWQQIHRQPPGVRQSSVSRLMDAGFLGPLPQADGGGPRAAAGADVGAASRSVDASCSRWRRPISSSARSIGSWRSRSETLKTRQESVDLTSRLESGGAVPLSDVRQAEELLYTATSQIPQIEQQIQQQENALRLLLGQTPGPVAHTDAERARAAAAGSADRVCHRSFWNGGRIFSRRSSNWSRPTRRSAWLARSSFRSSPSAPPPAWAAESFRTSSICPARPFTASDR